METIVNLWHKFVDFLLKYDFRTLAGMIRRIDWLNLVHNPVFWVVSGLILIAIIISRRYGYLLLIGSVAFLLFVFYKTVPTNPADIEFRNLLTFMFSTIAVVGINIYFFMLRK